MSFLIFYLTGKTVLHCFTALMMIKHKCINMNVSAYFLIILTHNALVYSSDLSREDLSHSVLLPVDILYVNDSCVYLLKTYFIIIIIILDTV